MQLSDHPLWRKPTHHLDLDGQSEHVHWTELFYDLIHVVTIFVLGNFLSSHLSLNGFVSFTLIFVALWFAWAELSAFNSIFVSVDMWHRLIMAAQITTVMFGAAAIPSIDGGGWPYFAIAYAINRFLLALMYRRAEHSHPDNESVTAIMTRQMLIFGMLFFITAFLPAPYNYGMFCVGLVMNQAMYMIPSTSALNGNRFVPRLEHFTERFGLLTLIVLGESFFKLVVTLADKGIYKASPDILANFVLGGFGTFVMAWFYFDFVGNGKPKMDSRRATVSWWLAHLLLMLSAVMVGVALAAEVKVGWHESYPYPYAVFGCFGLAGYILAIGIIQSCIEPRLAHRFSTWRLKLFGIVMAFITLAAVPYVTTLVGNILWSTALFSQVVVPLVRSYRILGKEYEDG